LKNAPEWLASAKTREEILDAYADLTQEDILAVMAFAAHMANAGSEVTDNSARPGPAQGRFFSPFVHSRRLTLI
jgi:hypothetical protein